MSEKEIRKMARKEIERREGHLQTTYAIESLVADCIQKYHEKMKKEQRKECKKWLDKNFHSLPANGCYSCGRMINEIFGQNKKENAKGKTKSQLAIDCK